MNLVKFFKLDIQKTPLQAHLLLSFTQGWQYQKC